MNLILFGFKGSGKTYFGKLLAEKLNRSFIDTDELLNREKPVRQLYRELGEKKFRALEKKAIRSLHYAKNSIIALGGGAILDPDNVLFLKNIGTLVYLKMGLETVKQRILAQELPAFINPKDPEKSVCRMIEEREPLYRSIGAKVIDVEALDIAGILALLTSILEESLYGI